MRSITPVIAIVVLLLMTIAAAAMAYLTIISYQEQASESTESGLGSLSSTNLKIESVSGGRIYLRNLDSEEFTGGRFYVDGRPLTVAGPSSVEPGKVSVFSVVEAPECDNQALLDMGRDIGPGTQRVVNCDELIPYTECGDGFCASSESCGPCPQDCGSCSLNIKNSTQWQGDGQADPYAVKTYDIDNDGTTEIITGGFISISSQLRDDVRVWNRTGGNLLLENASTTVVTPSIPQSLYVANIDEDPSAEIILVGDSLSQPQISVWNYTGGTVNYENKTLLEGRTFADVATGDIDSDGANEIVVAGWQGSDPYQSLIYVLNYTDNLLLVENSTAWTYSGSTICVAVSVYDIDNDGTTEIITGGNGWTGSTYEADLIIWNKTQGALLKEATSMWTTLGQTRIRDIYISDVDNDGTTEIITSGASNNNYYAQLRVWNYTFGALNLEASVQWQTGVSTDALSTYAADVDNDGTTEILTLGYSNGFSDSQLRVWNYTSGALNLEDSNEYNLLGANSAFSDLYAADVDNDGRIEITTVNLYDSLPYGLLRVWGYS
jgi:flagellin-like protein